MAESPKRGPGRPRKDQVDEIQSPMEEHTPDRGNLVQTAETQANPSDVSVKPPEIAQVNTETIPSEPVSTPITTHASHSLPIGFEEIAALDADLGKVTFKSPWGTEQVVDYLSHPIVIESKGLRGRTIALYEDVKRALDEQGRGNELGAFGKNALGHATRMDCVLTWTPRSHVLEKQAHNRKKAEEKTPRAKREALRKAQDVVNDMNRGKAKLVAEVFDEADAPPPSNRYIEVGED